MKFSPSEWGARDTPEHPHDENRVGTHEDANLTHGQLEAAHARIVELEALLDEAIIWAERAIEDVGERDQRIREYEARLALAKAESDAFRGSKAWIIVTTYRRLRDGWGSLTSRGRKRNRS